jgi:hypothetical protein
VPRSGAPRSPLVGWLGGGVGGRLVVRLAPGAWRAFVRGRRLRSGLAGGWTEIVATAIDLGLGAPLSDTPAEFAERVGASWESEPRAALAAVVRAVEEKAYADLSASGHPPVRRVLRRMAHDVSPGLRLWARLAPRSLRRLPRL